MQYEVILRAQSDERVLRRFNTLTRPGELWVMSVTTQTVVELDLTHLFSGVEYNPWQDLYRFNCRLVDHIDEIHLYEVPYHFEVFLDDELMMARHLEVRHDRMEHDIRRVWRRKENRTWEGRGRGKSDLYKLKIAKADLEKAYGEGRLDTPPKWFIDELA